MRNFKNSIIASIILSVALAACGGDSGTSPSDVIPDSVPGLPSSSSVKKSSSSSVIRSSSSVIQSGDSHEGSSNSKRSSSSSSKVSSSSAKATSSSSSAKIVSSSSKRSEGDPSSSSQKIASSSSVKKESSSSEYVPFDHSNTLASDWYVGENAYKQFTDPRNGRSYYYIKIIGKDQVGDKDSVTIMAENLNVGKMVLGAENQNNDSEIERYCYNNDTTKCDEFGGLYQWAEMMQLPSRCNTESCADLIEENHRGICPEGWRLMKWKDFYIAWHAESNDHGIEGVRSSYGFNGYNSTGLSLTGAGLRTAEGVFEDLKGGFYWAFPKEHSADVNQYVHTGVISASTNYAPSNDSGGAKLSGRSVRCVKIE